MEARILDELRTVAGDRGLISSAEELHTYECDGLTNFRVMPRAVLLPNPRNKSRRSFESVTVNESFRRARLRNRLERRRAPVENGIVISLARMNRILEVDFPNSRVVVEPGVIISTSRSCRAAGIFLRARSFFAIDLQHRRKRRGEFRRGALPEVRLYDNACPGPGSGSSRWLTGPSRRKNTRHPRL